MLNKQKGNMYGFITHTWNTVKGRCPYDCSYCFMKRFGKQAELHFDEAELKTDLYKYGENQFIFVGSSCDMWAEDVSGEWMLDTIIHTCAYPKNKYLVQSKNPKKIASFIRWVSKVGFFSFPKNFVIATTIETNRAYPEMGKAPPIGERVRALKRIKELGFQTMITIEPIMDFDFVRLACLIYDVRPDSVTIGADSQGHGLPEPGPEKIKALIKRLSEFTEIRQKPNLKRLLKG